ncbi:MAG: ExeA family protein [Planctomycetaceae bacterium]
MYLNHWRLAAPPFHNDHDPRSYYPGEPHEECLLRLQFAVEQRPGLALLLGEPGWGKSRLIRELAGRLDARRTPLLTVSTPGWQPAELLAWIAVELGIDPTQVDSRTAGCDRIWRELSARLEELDQQQCAPVLVLEDPQPADLVQLWPTLRALLGFAPQGHPTLSLLCVGPPELEAQLARFPALHDRLTARAVLSAFSAEDTAGYLAHRLRVVADGLDSPSPGWPFSPEALATAHQLSQGSPRRLNRLCDLALLVAFSEESREITPGHLATVAQEFCPQARIAA